MTQPEPGTRQNPTPDCGAGWAAERPGVTEFWCQGCGEYHPGARTAPEPRRRVPKLTPKDELLAILDDIRDRVSRDDSFDGSLSYEVDYEGGSPHFWVQACWRVGNSNGQGGMRMVGGWSDDPAVVAGRGAADGGGAAPSLADALKASLTDAKAGRGAADGQTT